VSQFGKIELQKIEKLVECASKGCSDTFSKWIHSEVAVDLDRVGVVSYSDLSKKVQAGDDVGIGIYLDIQGDLTGGLLYLFDEDSATRLIQQLTKKKDVTFSSVEQSALLETGNILASSYLSLLGNELGLQVVPGPPIFMHDMAMSILDSVLAEQALVQKDALLCNVKFNQGGKSLNCQFFFLPELERLKKVV